MTGRGDGMRTPPTSQTTILKEVGTCWRNERHVVINTKNQEFKKRKEKEKENMGEI